MRAKLEALVEPEIVAEPEIVVEPETVVPPPPVTVRLDSLEPQTIFELRGERRMVKEQVEGMVVCCNLFTNNVMTLGGSTMVKPIE